MTKVRSNGFGLAAEKVQKHAVDQLPSPGRMAIIRVMDPEAPSAYAPTASYSTQIRNHGARIGVDAFDHLVWAKDADNIGEVVRRFVEDPTVTSVMPLYNFGRNRQEHLERAAKVKEALSIRPEVDVDDLLGRGNRAPTARAMIAMGNVCMGRLVQPDKPFYVGRSLDEMSRLQLSGEFTEENIRIGGKGDLTGAPLRQILASQGIEISDEQVATFENQGALQNLPSPALVFTATPVAEQIRNEDITRGSIMIDAGFGVIDGKTYGNTDRRAADRSDVLWTPPREGVGPISTAYLFHHHLEAAGYPIEDLPPLGFIAMEESVAVY
jgi:5,10-methylene-tetrahydrofolate dehydrogenase/methenyl tetrahydrofolate cyclohydrolase